MALTTHERYIAREVVAASALVLFAFIALFAFFDLIHEFNDLGKGAYELPLVLLYVSLLIPGHLYELMPIAVLIGTLYSLTLLARHSEINVLRTAGLSTLDMLRTLAKIGLLFAALTFVFGEFAAPPAEHAAQQLRLSATGSLIGQEFRSGLWVRDEKNFVNVREVLPDASLLGIRGIRVFAFDDQHRLTSISQAASGVYAPPGHWQLTEVSRTVFESARARVEHLAQLTWASALTPDILSVLMVAPEHMSLAGLYQYITHLSENQQRTERYEIAFWKKLIYPLAALVMMALALPFAYAHDRGAAVSLKVFTGVMLGIGFYMLNGLFAHLGLINDWRPFTAAITPSALFLLLAAGMLWWVERR